MIGCTHLKINRDYITLMEDISTYDIAGRIIMIRMKTKGDERDVDIENDIKEKLITLFENLNNLYFFNIVKIDSQDTKFNEIIDSIFNKIYSKDINTYIVAEELINYFDYNDNLILLINYTGYTPSVGKSIMTGLLTLGLAMQIPYSSFEYCVIGKKSKKILLYNHSFKRDVDPRNEKIIQKHFNGLIKSLNKQSQKI